MKKWKITIAIVVVAILGLFFFLPRPVIREPEKAVLNSICIQKRPVLPKRKLRFFCLDTDDGRRERDCSGNFTVPLSSKGTTDTEKEAGCTRLSPELEMHVYQHILSADRTNHSPTGTLTPFRAE